MKVFLTGATGYVGSAIGAELHRKGHQVTALVRTHEAAERLTAQGFNTQLGSMSEPEKLLDTVRRVDAVIHTAFNHDFANFASNVAEESAFTQVIGKALAHSGRPFLSTHAAAYLGDSGDGLLDETAPLATGAEFQFALVRGKSEQAAVRLADEGVESLVFRLPHFVYGNGGSVFIPFLLEKAKASDNSYFIDAGENRYSAVHVEDAAALYVSAMENPVAGLYGVSGEAGISFRQIAEAVAINSGAVLQSFSKAEAKLFFGEVMTMFFSMNSQLSNRKAIDTFKWTPTTKRPMIEDIARGSYKS